MTLRSLFSPLPEASARTPLLDCLVTGIVAGAASVTVVLLGKVAFGVPTLTELAQDRILQHVPGPAFAFMLEHLLYLGKPALFVTFLISQIVITALIAVVAIRWRRPVEIALAMWLLTGIVLLPLVGRGVFDHHASVGLNTFLSFTAWAVVIVVIERARWARPVDNDVAHAPAFEAGVTPNAPSDSLSGATPHPFAGITPRPASAGVTRRAFVGGAMLVGLSAVLTKLAIGHLHHSPGINPDGLPDPITPNDSFYLVSKNLFDPEVDANDWSLRIDGKVDTPLTLKYADVTALPSEDFVRTLECISNEVGGDLISTGKFTGVRMSEVLQRAGVRNTAQMLHFTSVDGYTENMSVEKAMQPDTFLVYKLNGEPLPKIHGYPLRVLGAGTYGMKNPKWLTHIELVTTADEGFWEHQGWSPDAAVQTMSRIDSPRRSVKAGDVLVQGIAFAGDRSINAVEVSQDGGKTWSPANLLPKQGPLTWVFWQYAVTLATGVYDFVVRAQDGQGKPQVQQDSATYPSGASGYHHLEIDVSDKSSA